MLVIFIICNVLLLLAGMANGVMDKLQFHYGKSIFPQTEAEKLFGLGPGFWNPKQSWKHKYKNYPTDQRPRFPGAKTWLSWLTDGWHFFQMVMFTSFQLAIALPVVYALGWSYWWVLVALLPFKTLTGAGFSLLFDKLLHEKAKA